MDKNENGSGLQKKNLQEMIDFTSWEIKTDKFKQENHKTIQIQNIPILFPKSPYDVQSQFMTSVVEALNGQANALLQSPTGTGKTLSLICATLGWLKEYRKKNYVDNMNNADTRNIIKIIYASRTHTQLKQVAKELKSTAYLPKFSMLGSRDQLCINDNANKFSGSLLNQECKRLVKSGTCAYYSKEKIEQKAKDHVVEVLDIEDLKRLGIKQNICPYYLERSRKDAADIILMPYNYLLEKDFTDIIDVDNAIIIFDEAHNVQTVAEEGQSFFINQSTIVEAEKDLIKWIDQIDSTQNNYIDYTYQQKLKNIEKFPQQ
ncbi:hypothetical protein pb186bvf_020254 [Paramecium bursaria]